MKTGIIMIVAIMATVIFFILKPSKASASVTPPSSTPDVPQPTDQTDNGDSTLSALGTSDVIDRLPTDIAAKIEQYCAQYPELDVDTEKAQCWYESEGKVNAVSSAGAQGLFQLEPATAAQLGVTNSFDADQNIRGGLKYMHNLMTKYNGNYALALAAYNWGGGHVDKWQNGEIDSPPEETINYVNNILAAVGSTPQDYGVDV